MNSITLLYTHLNRNIQSNAMENTLDNILPFSLPWTMTIKVQNQYSQINSIINAITYNLGTQCNSVQLYFLIKPYSILN